MKIKIIILVVIILLIIYKLNQNNIKNKESFQPNLTNKEKKNIIRFNNKL